MKYCSTRGGSSGLTFEEALFSGYASDGGILLPERIPKLNQDQLNDLADKSYADIVKFVIGLYVGEEVNASEIEGIMNRALSTVAIPEKVHLAKLKGNLNVAELYHGPSLAFKDLALSVCGQFIQHFLNKKSKHVTIIVGTSGDTGSAAIESVKGLPAVDIIVLYPKGRCTEIQERQMTTVLDDNVHVYEVEGSSDDLDVPIKQCFTNTAFIQKHNICSINSINWCRIMVQIAHHIWAALQVRTDPATEVEIYVPTGALGNITAGIIAHTMGVPVKFVACVNSNDIVQRCFTTGDYATSTLRQTLAPAMDILEPYNMERILYLISNGDVKMVKAFQSDVEENGRAKIPADILGKINNIVRSYRVSDEELVRAMQRCAEENAGYLICPHTAVAVHCHYHLSSSLPRVCLATASPLKFESAVTRAGLQINLPDSLKALLNKKTRAHSMNKEQDWHAILNAKIEDITAKLQ